METIFKPVCRNNRPQITTCDLVLVFFYGSMREKEGKIGQLKKTQKTY